MISIARPTKDGADYFPVDVHFSENMELLEAEHGLKGTAVIVKLWQRIYGVHGYYCEWDEDIVLLLSRKFSLDRKTLSNIVQTAINRNIFHRQMLEDFHILTSFGIQKRYFEMAKRRDVIHVDHRYLLIKMPSNAVDVCAENDNANINALNVNIKPVDVDNSTQIKVNKSKLNKREGKTSHITPTLDEVKSFCEKNNLVINVDAFFFHYAAVKWAGIPDWQAKAKEWDAKDRQRQSEITISEKRTDVSYDINSANATAIQGAPTYQRRGKK